MKTITIHQDTRPAMRENRGLFIAKTTGIAVVSMFLGLGTAGAAGQTELDKIRATAEEAYIFAYPMLENYQTMYLQAIDPSSQSYAGFNVMYNETHLYGPEFKDIVRPNNDTVYSMAWLDLRAEPMVITVPAITNRYYSFQLVDLYTFNFAYIGTRTTGTNAGSYLVAGPQWRGSAPTGINAIFRSEGNFVYNVVRTAVDGETDLPNVLEIQQQYRLQTLSEYLERPIPPSVAHHPPYSAFPVWNPQFATNADFIGYFNFLLDQLSIYPTEKTLIASFARIGVGPGRPFNADLLRPDVKKAIDDGVASGYAKIKAKGLALGQQVNGWNLTPRIFGDRQQMEQVPDMYLVRAAAAALGLYGCNLEEAYYPTAHVDAEGYTLNAHGTNYVLRFGPDDRPLVDAFWSITMYDSDQHMVTNIINRYSIGDRTPGLTYVDGDTLEIYIQNQPPTVESQKTNWLPAPDGEFTITLRMYLPEFRSPDSLYEPPPVLKQD